MKKLIIELVRLFEAKRNPEIAQAQEAYMRNQFAYFGIKSPDQKILIATALTMHPLSTEQEVIDVVTQLWNAKERELHYAAFRIAIKYKKLLTPLFIPVAQQILLTHSWWDTVDAISSNLVGNLVSRYPTLTTVMDQWIRHENLWLRRSALLHQLMYKDKTDEKRLFSHCKQLMHEKDFFIRKAVGWALRQYSKTHPTAVKSFIEENRSFLSPLSIKEGSKYL